MAIATKINSLITAINNITGKSRTDLTSAVQDLKDNQPTGSITITENGTYDVTEKASAVVNTPTAPDLITVVNVPFFNPQIVSMEVQE